MNVISVATSTQSIWEEIRQETMRNAPKTDQTSDGQEVSIVSKASRNPDGDGMVAIIKQVKAAKKNGGSGTSAAPGASPATSTVTTDMENVGPNAYERIRINAGKTYLAQAGNYSVYSAAEDKEVPGLRKSV
jgi:hypothetical protein